MKVRFSRLSVFKLEKLLEYLEVEWSENSKNTFLNHLKSKIELIKSNPQVYQASSLEPELRKCVVTKQTTILYEIQHDTIFILNVIDTRQDPEKIKAEIEKYFG